MGIDDLDTDNQNDIWKYFFELEDENEVKEFIDMVFQTGEIDLAEELHEKADKYFGWTELSNEEVKAIDSAEQWEKSMPAPRKRATRRIKGQKGRPGIDHEKRMRKVLGGVTGKEIIRDMNPVEKEHEGVFSDLYQGGGTRKKIISNNPVKKKEAEEKEKRNYLNQLEAVRDQIINGSYLVRKMSQNEKKAFQDGGKKDDIFPKGKEGMKAFAIDKIYTFSDKERDSKQDDYQCILQINLTSQLKTFFINYLSANVTNPLGVADKKFHFNFNPQFKFEGGGVTILIPPSGWVQFWSFVTGYSFR